MDAQDFYRLTPSGRTRRLRRLAQEALERYDLTVRRLRTITTETNAVFAVEADEGRFILRVGRGGTIQHSQTQVLSELAFLEALADSGIDAPIPVRNREQDALTRVIVDGVPYVRNVVLFRRLPGRLLGDRLHPSTVRRYGALAARLHRFAETWSPPPDFRVLHYDRTFPFDEPVRILEGSAGFITKAQQATFLRAHDLVERVIAGLARREPPRVIHADLHRWNVVVHRGRLGVFDFEDLMWGWPIQDIAVALYYVVERDDFADLLRWFREGYETVTAWPGSYGQLAALIAGRALVMANTVVNLDEPEYRTQAPEWLERIARRVDRFIAEARGRITA
jgi:Ser/Thr protein kinase RdoA (MazF antagonist)